MCFHFKYSNCHHIGQSGTQFSFAFQTLYIPCLSDGNLFVPVPCCDKQMSEHLIFTINTCKRPSEFAFIQVVKLDICPGSVSTESTGEMSLWLYYNPTHRKISSIKDNTGSSNKLCLFFQRPRYTPRIVGSQDCRLLPFST